jgi:hypothetical protein
MITAHLNPATSAHICDAHPHPSLGPVKPSKNVTLGEIVEPSKK